MMKDIGYAGVYHGESAAIGATLEDPRKFNLAANTLVFVVTAEARGGGVVPQMNDLRFYVLDEHDRMYNTEMIPYSDNAEDAPSTLICTELRPEFVFQSLRLVVYFKDCERMGIIQLRH